MYFEVLLIFIVECVTAINKSDIGDIPYENQGGFPGPSTTTTTVSVKDYGEISYESVKINDYGEIEYEKGKKSSAGVDYGDIPLEKETSTINIPEMVKALLGGREVPGVVKTTTAPAKMRTSSTSTSSLSTLTTTLTTTTTPAVTNVTTTTDFTGTYNEIQMRAFELETLYIGDYDASTIDDSLCKENCSTCTDGKGYRVYCLAHTTTPSPQGLYWLVDKLVDLTKEYEDYNTPQKFNYTTWEKNILAKWPSGWPDCITTTTTTPTPPPTDAPHELVGTTIAQCYVCGMLESGIPTDYRLCADSYLAHHYKKHCKFLNRDGWHLNGTAGFYMWGRWTGGCSMRFVDITPVYTQRTCRDKVNPALGAHYVSRRMAKMEHVLSAKKDGCMQSPMASLVPLSRGISLFSRFTVCVCSGPYCNRSERLSPLSPWLTVVFSVIIILSNNWV